MSEPVLGAQTRIVSLDQFRGLTILGMFAVQYAGCMDWTANLSLLRHNNTYLSFADLVLPGFLLASGAALRLTMLKRQAAGGMGAVYRRAVWRALLLVLLSPVLTRDRWLGRARDAWEAGGWPQAVSEFFKRGLWEPLAVIALASLWVLPVITTRPRTRGAFLFGGLAVHAVLCHFGYFHYLLGVPNRLDAWLVTAPTTGYEGGMLGLLTMAVPLLAGSLAYDLVAQGRNWRTVSALLTWSGTLLLTGYGLSCLSNLYPRVQPPTAQEGLILERDQVAARPVVPPVASGEAMSWRSLLAAPPLVPPRPEQQRWLNYWQMSKRVLPPTFALAATGIALGVYALLVLLCEIGAVRIGLLRTFGGNPLVAYVLNLYVVANVVRAFWPADTSWPWGMGHMLVWFGITYLCVRLLERQRIFVRL